MLISSKVYIVETGQHIKHTRLLANVFWDIPDHDLLYTWSEGELDFSVDYKVGDTKQLDPVPSGLGQNLLQVRQVERWGELDADSIL